MYRVLAFVWTLLFCASSLSGADVDTQNQAGQKPLVLVTVAPHRYLVKQIAGDTVDVDVIVPPVANVHTFEPTPKQMIRAAQADVWFRIGEFFETQLGSALKKHHPGMVIVDLRQNLDLIYGDDEHVACCHHAGSADLHFWLSPKQLMIQAQNVFDHLSTLYPQHKARYEEALKKHQEELKALDQQLRLLFGGLRQRTILVAHPAYGYLGRDYAIEQLTVEIEGKEPTPKQLSQLLRKAKELNLRTLFTQVQYPQKIAERIVQEMGPHAKMVVLDPYAEDYMQNMRTIANAFYQG